MRTLLALLSSSMPVAACCSPVAVRVERSEPGGETAVRHVEFEDHRLSEPEHGGSVILEHDAPWMPWPFVRHYLGETLTFEFPAPGPEGEAVAVCTAHPEVSAQMPVKARFRQDTAIVSCSGGDGVEFRLVFDTSESGDGLAVLTFTERVPR